MTAEETLLADETESNDTDAGTQDETASEDTQSGSEQDESTDDADDTSGESSDDESRGESKDESKEGDESESDESSEKDGEKDGAPEAYKDFEVPDGMPDGVQLDDDVAAALEKGGREANLSQKQIQTVIDHVWPAMQRRADQQNDELHTRWFNEIKVDKDYGGENLKANMAHAKRALQKFGNDELTQLLSGPLENHPGLFKAFVEIGKTVSEDNFVRGDASDSVSDSEAADLDDLYDHPTSRV